MGRYRQWILQQINDLMAGKNAIEMCSIHNKGKSVIVERFVRALKNNVYKYRQISLSKNVCIDKLADIV